MRTKLVYISGGDSLTPAEIKAALDGIRKNLNLPADTVLFGLPTPADTAPATSPPVQDHKILQFPKVKKSSILNVIENPEEKSALADAPLVVDDVDDAAEPTEAAEEDAPGITALFDGLPPLGEEEEDAPPTAIAPTAATESMVQEFSEYLSKSGDGRESPAPVKKARPFGRKGKGVLTNMFDLFTWAGNAANDDEEDFALPDYIKRP